MIAGGVPVTPFNVVLEQRHLNEAATLASLETFARAGRLYSEFAAHRGRSFIGVLNDEFTLFVGALQGRPFVDTSGRRVFLSSAPDRPRGKRTCDLMLRLLYSIAIDVEELYGVNIDWRRYRGIPNNVLDTIKILGGPYRAMRFRRVHRVKHTTRKVVGLPDEQFALLLRQAYARWGDVVAEGDVVYGASPEQMRGALFFRNLAILCVLRYAGSRRSEVAYVEFGDIDPDAQTIRLVTKGHGGEGGERLPVIMFPLVYDAIRIYAARYRPVPAGATRVDRQRVFLSHSLRNYGHPIGAQSVRAVIDTLRPALDPPWNETLTPHMLRHSFGYDLQRHSGQAAVVTNMRHASILSSAPYGAGPEIFADELLPPLNSKIEEMFAQAGLSEAASE